MKKILCVAFAAFGFLFTSQAQEVEFGAKGGLNLFNRYGDNVGNTDFRTSFHVGGVAEIKFTEKFSLQPELLFSSQGSKYDLILDGFSEINAPEGTKATLTEKLNYINLPVIAKYYVAKGLSLEAGPQLGFLASAKRDLEFSGDTMDFDVDDEYDSFDFGLNFGLGYKLDNGLFFNGRYNLGLTNITDNNVRNEGFQFSVGFMF
ncbi:porin family protein [Zhouia amylolytica]|uniref:Outer membrane protein beta-barrel domain-containing protein n=1 Tax=Zhouia amylolytica AD3 TaxID=1286632 RepID=W2USS9_9FLAO|nr:porin family protein [Zhouia amylolytica]ETN96536.1 hypothetical protein P278_06140 [Zhouia amylolytica AD3]